MHDALSTPAPRRAPIPGARPAGAVARTQPASPGVEAPFARDLVVVGRTVPAADKYEPGQTLTVTTAARGALRITVESVLLNIPYGGKLHRIYGAKHSDNPELRTFLLQREVQPREYTTVGLFDYRTLRSDIKLIGQPNDNPASVTFTTRGARGKPIGTFSLANGVVRTQS